MIGFHYNTKHRVYVNETDKIVLTRQAVKGPYKNASGEWEIYMGIDNPEPHIAELMQEHLDAILPDLIGGII